MSIGQTPEDLGENDPETEAERYTNLVNEIVRVNNNLPWFEIIILGIGEDGHTASIFPDQMELLVSDRIFKVAVHPLSNQKRITITGKIINNADKIYFLAAGRSKSSIVNKVINKKNDYLNYPASFIKTNKTKVLWFLDKEAASEIKTN